MTIKKLIAGLVSAAMLATASIGVLPRGNFSFPDWSIGASAENEDTENTYTVHFDPNGGTGTTADLACVGGENTTLPKRFLLVKASSSRAGTHRQTEKERHIRTGMR